MDVLRFLRANTLARAVPAAKTAARLTTRVGPAVVRAKRRAWTHAGDHAAGRISPVGGGREAQKLDRDADEGREYPRPIERVSERERKIGRDQKAGWGVSYVASIRINVNGIKREGVGAGHGIDVDPGQAHESAIKEAATDAMKRALMTFGNQFGLALYDKEQRNVEDKPLNLGHVSESEKTAKKFIETLIVKMEQAGINSDGIKTLKAILKVAEFEDVKEAVRPKLLEKITPEYAAMLNVGQNAKGEQVIQIVTKDIAQSTADLQKAADEVLR